jgi:hypothetical protein
MIIPRDLSRASSAQVLYLETSKKIDRRTEKAAMRIHVEAKFLFIIPLKWWSSPVHFMGISFHQVFMIMYTCSVILYICI